MPHLIGKKNNIKIAVSIFCFLILIFFLISLNMANIMSQAQQVNEPKTPPQNEDIPIPLSQEKKPTPIESSSPHILPTQPLITPSLLKHNILKNTSTPTQKIYKTRTISKGFFYSFNIKNFIVIFNFRAKSYFTKRRII